MDRELVRIGFTPDQNPNVFRLIDRKDKLNPEQWMTYGFDMGLTSEKLERLNTVLNNKDLWKNSRGINPIF